MHWNNRIVLKFIAALLFSVTGARILRGISWH